MDDKKLIFGYWAAQGIGQSSRYLLSIVGANW
jgi:hypothetical protein